MIANTSRNDFRSFQTPILSQVLEHTEGKHASVFRRAGNASHCSAVPVGRESIATVYVVGDDGSIREPLEALIGCAGWLVETFASAHEFLEKAGTCDMGCIILDISLSDLGGLELQERLARDRMNFPIIFITDHGDVPTAVRAMKAGAIEFLTKPIVDGFLLAAIEEALWRSRRAFEERTSFSTLLADFDSLSNRERQVMALIVKGLLNKQVGGDLGISEITVKAHRGQVMRKMKARSFAELVIMGAKLGISRVEQSGTERIA